MRTAAWTIVIALALAAPPAAAQGPPVAPPAAQTPGAEEAARQLFRLTVSPEMIGAVVGQMSQIVAGVMAAEVRHHSGADLNAAELGRLHEAVQRVMGEFFGGQGFEDAAVAVYTRHFDGAELAEMVRFYRSPAGAKWTRLGPTIYAEMAAVGQRIGQSPQMRRRLLEELRRVLPDRVKGLPES